MLTFKQFVAEGKTLHTASDVVRAVVGKHKISHRYDWNKEQHVPAYGKVRIAKDHHPNYKNYDSTDGSGTVGLKHRYGKRPKDHAEAGHEAHHALLHMQGKDSNNEHEVNRLTKHWLKHKSGFKGSHLKRALDHIKKSEHSYSPQRRRQVVHFARIRAKEMEKNYKERHAAANE